MRQAAGGLRAAVHTAARRVDESMRNDCVGRSVGPDRRRLRLAEGGMGSVYLGDRADGAFEQLVAIERQLGAVDPALAERFRIESANGNRPASIW